MLVHEGYLRRGGRSGGLSSVSSSSAVVHQVPDAAEMTRGMTQVSSEMSMVTNVTNR